jgi:DNA-binding GntR family transcriptional regulator
MLSLLSPVSARSAGASFAVLSRTRGSEPEELDDSEGEAHMADKESPVDQLRRDILSGVYAPGERLIELDLSERYECGRAAVRAALVQLESESLVDRKVNRGAVVHRIDVSEAIEITEARAVLESLIAQRAARNTTPADNAVLEQIISGMRAAVAGNEAAAYSELNRKLHAELARISAHQVAESLVDNLRHRGLQNQFRLSVMPGRQAVSLEQHAAIVTAVVTGDEQAASEAMLAHLDSVIDVLEQWSLTT